MDEAEFRLNSEPVRCRACGERFNGETALGKHYKKTHPGLSVSTNARLGGRLNELYPIDNSSIHNRKTSFYKNGNGE